MHVINKYTHTPQHSSRIMKKKKKFLLFIKKNINIKIKKYL